MGELRVLAGEVGGVLDLGGRHANRLQGLGCSVRRSTGGPAGEEVAHLAAPGAARLDGGEVGRGPEQRRHRRPVGVVAPRHRQPGAVGAPHDVVRHRIGERGARAGSTRASRPLERKSTNAGPIR